jgi:Ni,Fe-hydrogenase III component G
MKLEQYLDNIKERFPDDVIDTEVILQRRGLVSIRKNALINIAHHLFEVEKCRFIIASGMDSKEGIEILYHFSKDEWGYVINLQVILDRSNPEVESLTALFAAADWIEREIHEILGVNFLNHPNLEPFISAGNWAEDEFPYRRSNHIQKTT